MDLELTIVIPAYNEEKRILPTLHSVINYFDKQNINYQILVVNDGSTDKTYEVVSALKKTFSQIEIIQTKRNCGKGYSVKLAMLQAKSKLMLLNDADGATPIDQYQSLLHEINNGYEIVIGSRAMPATDTVVKTRVDRKLLGRTFNFFVNLLILPGLRDTQCGFKLFTRNAAHFVFERQTSDRFSFDVEILFIAKQAKIKIKEVAINWNNIPGSKVNVVRDGLKMLLEILFFRFRHKNILAEEWNNYRKL